MDHLIFYPEICLSPEMFSDDLDAVCRLVGNLPLVGHSHLEPVPWFVMTFFESVIPGSGWILPQGIVQLLGDIRRGSATFSVWPAGGSSRQSFIISVSTLVFIFQANHMAEFMFGGFVYLRVGRYPVRCIGAIVSGSQADNVVFSHLDC